MTPMERAALRAEVRAVLREVLPEIPGAGPAPAVEPVSIRDDAELAEFVRRLLRLFDDPRNRDAIRSGLLTFRLATAPAPNPAPSAAPGAAARTEPGRPDASSVRRVERGAVTEAQVVRAAGRGERLVLGRRAVLTPLAKDKARSLGVRIDKEDRPC